MTKGLSWGERIVYWLLLLALGAVLVLQWRAKLPVALFVDGKPIAWLATSRLAQEALRLAKEEMERRYGKGTEFAESVLTGNLPLPNNEQLISPAEAAQRLLRQVRPARRAWLIVINDQPILALTRKEDAEQALEQVKAFFVPSDLPLVRPPRFKERVIIRQGLIAPDRVLTDPEEAARRLTQGLEPPRYHLVKSGEVALRIARRYGLSLAELQRLNPHRNLDRLKVGDRLLVRVGKPLVTVVSVHQLVTHEPVPYKVERRLVPSMPGGAIVTKQRGKEGVREIVWEILCENGQEVRRRRLKSRIVREPVTEILLIGGGLPRTSQRHP
jgi:hypothetical protein